MKTKIAIVAAAVMLSSSAFAATEGVSGGRVDFYGKVTNVSCTISVDGQGSDANVYLAPVSVKELVKDTLVRPTQFHIDVTECKDVTTKWINANQVAATDDTGTITPDKADGLLINDAADGAKNVYLALSTTTSLDNKIIPGDDNNPQIGVDIINGTRFTYNVGYVARLPANADDNATPTAGDVHSYAVYEVSYK